MRKIGPFILGWALLVYPLLLASLVLGMCGYASDRLEKWLTYCMDKLEG